jgi:O-antigen ligase
MPPIVASLISLALVAYLFQRDIRERPNVTSALWLPFFWVTLSGTRFLSQWLAIFGFNLGGASVEDGSPLDGLSFLIMIVLGTVVLHRRQVNWQEFIRRNPWVAIYLIYCLVAVVWSDFPFVAVKRWIKLFGQPVMVMVLLTEPDPMESFRRLMKRFAYVLAPLSILFIKYYPAWGRSFDLWSGLPMNTGITTNKNILGCDCFIVALFFIWHFIQTRRRERGPARRNELLLCLFMFAMLAWLFNSANSSTSLGVLILGVAIMLFLGLKFVDLRHVTGYLMFGLVVLLPLDLFFGLHDYIIQLLGRNPTLTGRTDIWNILLHWDLNPLVGVGFESFWLGDHVGEIAAMEPGLIINEAHNGYLETYINLGLLGIALTLAMVVAAYHKSRLALLEDFEFGRFRLAYLAAFLVYNWTEAAFRTHCFPFFIFFLIAIDYERNLLPAADPHRDYAVETDEETKHPAAAAPEI